MSQLPDSNHCYSSLDYWNNRYESEKTYDWFTSYASFRHIIQTTVKTTDRILILGCGNSTLSECMYKDGYCHIVNTDYSPVVIQNMKNHCDVCAAMEWIVMDVRDVTFPKESFDVVIEKGVLDALLVDKKDPWHPSMESTMIMDSILTQISEILKNGGRFVSITFDQPHFRRKLYEKPQFQWLLNNYAIGETFHYYIYVMKKSKSHNANCDSARTNDESCYSLVHHCIDPSTDMSDADFLYNICI